MMSKEDIEKWYATLKSHIDKDEAAWKARLDLESRVQSQVVIEYGVHLVPSKVGSQAILNRVSARKRELAVLAKILGYNH